MSNSLSISFICRESKVNRMGLAPIECSVIYGGSRTFIQLPRKECPDNFRRLMKCRRGNELKDFCLAYYGVVQSAFSCLFCSGVSVTPAILKQYLRGEYCVSYTVSQLCKEYLDLLKKRVDCDDLTMQVYFKYERIYRRLIERVGSELPVKELSNGILRDFLTLLKKDYGEATVCGYWTKVKCLIRYAIDNGKLSVNPCAGIKVSRGQKRVTIFTMEEYERVRDKVIDIDRLDRVRDLFVFGCNCGLAFCDIVSLSPDDIREVDLNNSQGMMHSVNNSTIRNTASTEAGQSDTNTDKRTWYVIEKRRRKTGIVFSAVVLGDGVSILRKYNFDLRGLISISNQKCNAYLKELGDICRVISVPSLHYHLCRHFYITRLLRSGVSPAVVKLCAGHSNIKLTTSTYSHLTSVDVVRVINSAALG